MYNIRWLANVARQGFADMLPAAHQAFNDDPTDDRLPLVYGRRGLPWAAKHAEQPPGDSGTPSAHGRGRSMRTRLILIAIAGVVIGSLLAPFSPEFLFFNNVNWPAVVLGGLHALLFRRYLFNSDHAREDDFPWLAASLAPSLGVLMIASLFGWLVTVTPEDGGVVGWVTHALVSLTHALGVAASLIIAVAALCYSRDWTRALVQLAVRLFVFRIMVWVTTLVLLEIGIVGPIVAGVLRGVFGFSLPEWISDLADAISYAVVMSVIYLAVIGASWTVCRQRFGALLRTGDVDVLQEVARLASAPKPPKKSKKKAKDKPKHSNILDDISKAESDTKVSHQAKHKDPPCA